MKTPRGPGGITPSVADLADAAFLALLGGLALAELRTTYAGWSFLIAGLAGLALGLLVAHVGNAMRLPMVVVAPVAVVVFFGFGGAATHSDQAVAGILPTLGTVRLQAVACVSGWKALLSALPPVDDGALLVIPYLLGLCCGVVGLSVARRVRVAPAPLVVPGLVLGATILLGTDRPAAQLADGVGFALVSLFWVVIRNRRRFSAGRTRSHGATSVAMSAGLLVGAAMIAAVLGPLMPGVGATHRVVGRDHITPPLDLAAYPSPLVGFRKYTKDANQLWDQPLLTVSGLPDGALVRIATLNEYDGKVWGATADGSDPGFRTVGSQIGTAAGRDTTLRVTVGPAYALANDVNAWLPTAGTVTSVNFGGTRRTVLKADLRYNVATSAAIVVGRLRAGDKYTIHTVLDTPTIPGDAQPYGRPEVGDTEQSLVGSRIATWTKGATGIGPRLRAVAAYLRTNGAYSDGGAGETQYLPGHSTGRLMSFLNATRPVGDDEQYAAAYALIANNIGMPTRVVLGARPGVGGVVRGADIHAWVEIHLADGRWAPIPQTDFMPDTTKKPDQQPPQAFENANAAVVPPPNTVRLPSSLDDSNQVDTASRRKASADPPLWRNVVSVMLAVAVWAGPPVLAVALPCGAVIGLKTRRRRRRRTRGSTALRYAAGWRELVDHAMDLGTGVPAGQTRRSNVARLGRFAQSDQPDQPRWPALSELAQRADAAVYGPGDPTEAQAIGYWRDVDTARRAMSGKVQRWRRALGAVDVRTLRWPAPGRLRWPHLARFAERGSK